MSGRLDQDPGKWIPADWEGRMREIVWDSDGDMLQLRSRPTSWEPPASRSSYHRWVCARLPLPSSTVPTLSWPGCGLRMTSCHVERMLDFVLIEKNPDSGWPEYFERGRQKSDGRSSPIDLREEVKVAPPNSSAAPS